MRTYLFLALALFSSVCFAADTPPSEESIKELLTVMNARKTVDTMMTQVDGMMRNVMQQALRGETPTPQAQAMIDKTRENVIKMLKEELDWSTLEPMYVRIYQESFTQEEVNGLLTFYKSPAGKALIVKMPKVIQNSMTEMQKRMGPMMEKIQAMERETIEEVKADAEKKETKKESKLK